MIRIIGVLLLVIGIGVFWMSHRDLGRFDTIGGKLAAAVSSGDAQEKKDLELRRILAGLAALVGFAIVASGTKK